MDANLHRGGADIADVQSLGNRLGCVCVPAAWRTAGSAFTANVPVPPRVATVLIVDR